MFCTECGKALVGDEPKFCSSCGTPVVPLLPNAGISSADTTSGQGPAASVTHDVNNVTLPQPRNLDRRGYSTATESPTSPVSNERPRSSRAMRVVFTLVVIAVVIAGAAIGVFATRPKSPTPTSQPQSAASPSAAASAATPNSTLAPTQAAEFGSPTCAEGGQCRVGDKGPGGGIVFITPDTNGNSSGLNFEIAPASWAAVANEPFPAWCSDESASVTHARGSAIGSGGENTSAMVGQCSEGAANSVTGYRGGGKSDWFLPSKDELNEAFINRTLIGDLRSDKYSNYWSSTEDSASSHNAWTQMVLTGDQTADPKGYGYFVRPVRTFSSSDGAPASSKPPTSSKTTMIRLVVNGCEGCTVGVQRGIEFGNPNKIRPARPDYWNGKKADVVNGVVVLKVPTRYTSGMSFTLTTPWEGDTGAVTNIVLGSSVPTGTTVTTAQALATPQATACWAGTTQPEATLDVQVAQINVEGYSGPTLGSAAWASPTVDTVGPLTATHKGTLGNQEAFYC